MSFDRLRLIVLVVVCAIQGCQTSSVRPATETESDGQPREVEQQTTDVPSVNSQGSATEPPARHNRPQSEAPRSAEPRQARSVSIPLPALVELPGGAFYLGDQTNRGDADERPVQEVEIAPFAIGQYEITFTEYDAFSRATGRRLKPDANWGRGKRPVIYISWQDAQDYVAWLSDQTGERWRLPTEAEWEYAARAGAFGLYQTGNRAADLCKVANIADQTVLAQGLDWRLTECRDGATYSNEVGRYRANGFGLYDMHGNVWEWVADCYRPYSAATTAGTRRDSDCSQGVVRGGGFQAPADSARLTNRQPQLATQRLNYIGFRVVKAP